MKTSESDLSATAQSPAKTQETRTGYGAAAPDPAGQLLELQRSAGNAAVSQLVRRATAPAPVRSLQRGVYAEAGAKAVAVPQYAKTHATWVNARNKPGGWLDMNVVPFNLPNGAPAYKYEKFKGRWYVGHMIFQNQAQPDGNRLPASDTYREYDVHEWTGAPRGKERIVVGASRRTWYTNNHYNDFTEFR